MVDPIKLAVDSALEVEGREDTPQLTVKGYSTQTEPLQTWQDQTGGTLAQIGAGGQLQIGGEPGTPEALIEAHQTVTLPSTQPKRGWWSVGQMVGSLSQTISDAITWIAHELQLSGEGDVSGLHTALRAVLRLEASGDVTQAGVRAGDFQAENRSGSTGAAVGQLTGVRGTIDNGIDAHLDKAVGVEAALFSDGDITEAAAFEVASPGNNGTIGTLVGLKIPDLDQGTDNYAIHTGKGPAHFGDMLEMEAVDEPDTPPQDVLRLYTKSDGKPYVKNWSGTEYDLTSGTGGGASAVFNIIAGETVSAGQVVYRDPSDSKWYLVDITASPPRIGPERAIAAENIAADASGSGQQLGLTEELYTGLTDGQDVWLSTTAGTITQIRPDPSLDGEQVAWAKVGRAIGATQILLSLNTPVRFGRRVNLANSEPVVIQHYADEGGILRTPMALRSVTVPGESPPTPVASQVPPTSTGLRSALQSAQIDTDTPLSGTYIYGGTWSGSYPVSNAIDGNTGTLAVGTSGSDVYVGIDLGAGNDEEVRAVRIYRYNQAYGCGFEVQYSDDGSTWYDTGAKYISPSVAQWYVYDVPPSGSHRYWRLHNSEEEPDFRVNEFEFYALDDSGVLSLDDYGTPNASSYLNTSYTANYAFDGLTTTCWISDGSDYDDCWIQAELDVSTYALSYDIVAQWISVPRTPAGWRLYGSNSGDFSGEEVLLDRRSGETGWVAYERRSYTITNPGSYKYYRWQISDTEYSQSPGSVYNSSIGLIELYVEAQSRESIATPFEVQDDYLADYLKILMKRVGFIGDIAYSLAIHEDDGGEPATTAVSGGTISADFSGVSKASAEWMTLHFDAPITLTRGTKYWLVLSSDQSYSSASRCIEWQAGGDDNELIYGNCFAEIDGVWTELNDVAVNFEVHRYQLAVDEIDADGAMNLFCTNGTTYEDIAQSFELDDATDVGGLRLYLKRTGAPSDNMTVEIQTDSSDAPSGTPVTNATSQPVPMDYLEDEGVYQWIDFSFPSTVSLSANTKYWIVLSSDGSASSTTYISWATVTESYSTFEPDICVISEITASDTYHGYTPVFACDDDPDTTWRALTTGSGYLQFSLAASEVVKFLSITASATTVAYAPTDIELLASNTGAFGGEEVSLVSDSGLSWTVGETKEWTFSNSTAYAYYRLSLTYSGNYPEVAEVELRNTSNDTRGCLSGTMLYYDSSAWVNAGGVDGCFHLVPASTSVEEKMLLGSWSTTKAEVGNRYGDPTGANYDTQTSFVGIEDDAMDCVLMVELP